MNNESNGRRWIFLGKKRGMINLKCPHCGWVKSRMHKWSRHPTRCRMCNKELFYPENL
jgi:uncharacterized C2H2 Zn-finger protein